MLPKQEFVVQGLPAGRTRPHQIWIHNGDVKKLLALCVALTILVSACAPPAALKRLVGRDSQEEVPEISNELFPPPSPPPAPAQLLFGTVILSNEPGWGTFFDRGQLTLGALVLDVLPDTPAARQGLKAGDVITEIDGQFVYNHEKVLVAFRDRATAKHNMKVIRVDGSTLEFEASLVPPGGFSLLRYLEGKVAASPDPVNRYLLAEQVEDNDRAIEIIKSVIAEYPTFPEGYALLARRLLNKVEAKVAGGATAPTERAPSSEIQDMLSAIDRAVELDPEAPGIRRARSQIHLSLGNGAKAEEDATKALEIDESSAESLYLLGTSELTLRKYREALERLYLAVQFNPYEPKYYVNLALGYRSLGREDDARTTFVAAKSLVTDPATIQRLDDLAAGSG